jgi:uncharacterized membrane protein YbaN (DUF454 family)
MKTIILLTAGWLCILLGAAGLVLPFIPGAVLLLIGITLLSQHYSWARRLLVRARDRFPNIWRSIHEHRTKTTRFRMRVKEGLQRMKLHRAIKYLVIALAIAAEIIEEQVFHRLLIAYGKHPADTVWDDIALGTTFGIVLFVILTLFDKAKEHERRRARMIAGMNHHIRNALQVIQYGLTDNATMPAEYVRDAINRIEWALREVLPDEEAGKEYRPQPQSVEATTERKLAG